MGGRGRDQPVARDSHNPVLRRNREPGARGNPDPLIRPCHKESGVGNGWAPRAGSRERLRAGSGQEPEAKELGAAGRQESCWGLGASGRPGQLVVARDISRPSGYFSSQRRANSSAEDGRSAKQPNSSSLRQLGNTVWPRMTLLRLSAVRPSAKCWMSFMLVVSVRKEKEQCAVSL